jgi:hypothetical protein
MGLLLLSQTVFAQSVAKKSRQNETRKNKAAIELSKSLEEGNPDELLAKQYMKLAKELTDNNEYEKAEDNYLKAKTIYVKLKQNENVVLVEREIAKLKELQDKFDEAISGYQSAGEKSKDVTQQALNHNDANRLLNRSNSAAQSQYIDRKIELLESTDNKKEIADAYRQKAQANMEMEQPEAAISNYNQALKVAEEPQDEIKIKKEMANVYATNQQMDKAIEINEEIVAKAMGADDPGAAVEQLLELASTYFEASDDAKGLQTLWQAYELALSHGQTLDAKRCVELLAEYYRTHKKEKEAIRVYAGFIAELDPLIHADSSLVDARIFRSNEERIAQLENERALKDELIERKNTFNYFLLSVIVLILILLVFIVRALFSIRLKNKKIALQSLRREMNPHFIFNSLNSVNQFIAQNKELEANKYLSSYSRLMRNVMENSNKDFIPLSVELSQLKEYLQLEYMRFSDKFTYDMEVDETLDAEAIRIPNMLIQPQLENAIWHGLRYRETQGRLWLKIGRAAGNLQVLIEDNGIGIQQSQLLKTNRQKEHKSRGLTNTYERIELLNNLYHSNIQLVIEEKEGEASGVRVRITIPLK